MYMVLCLIISIVSIAIVAIPLFFMPSQKLEASATENSVEKLERVKQAILRRYIEEEEIHAGSGVAGVVWEQRKNFLINRYLDAARRLDYLDYLDKNSASEAKGGSSHG